MHDKFSCRGCLRRQNTGKWEGPGNGENYDMYPPWWKQVGTKEYQEQIGIGWWRVDVEPEAKSRSDLLLHVLWATGDRARKMFPVETIERTGQTGVRFVADGILIEASCAKTGDLTGHIRMMKEGRALADGPLPVRVNDHYNLWRADPRFQDWSTNPAIVLERSGP